MKKARKILIVEDEIVIAECLELELTMSGHTVCSCVVTGEDAIVAAEREHPDVILMDIRLAGEIDGIEAAKRIQALLGIPIVFMTGYLEDTIRGRAMELNPLTFLTKPVKLRDIQKALAALSG
jgi:CheY-like chemotaxis protein